MSNSRFPLSHKSIRRHLVNTTILTILFLGAVVIAALWMFRPQPALRSQLPAKSPAVEVLAASPQVYQIQVRSQGTVVPHRQITLIAEVSGRVQSVAEQFVDGGRFTAGDKLVQLDGRDYEIAVINARSALANAERELALERGQARQAEREWQNLGSREANDLFLRKPQIKAAEAAVSAAQAMLRQAELNLSRTQIRAAFNGRVLTTEVNLGQFAPQGTVVARIYDSERAEVRLPLTTQQLLQTGLSLGQLTSGELSSHNLDGSATTLPPVILSAILGERELQWQARILGTDASIDTDTRFINLIAIVDQPFSVERHAQPLLMGLFVEARIPGKKFPSSLRLPDKAVLDDRVFVVDESSKRLQSRSVRVIARESESLWVEALNIEAGDKIVVSDPRVLREDMAVTVIENESSTNKLNRYNQGADDNHSDHSNNHDNNSDDHDKRWAPTS